MSRIAGINVGTGDLFPTTEQERVQPGLPARVSLIVMSGYDDFSDYQGDPADGADEGWPRLRPAAWLWLGVLAVDIGSLIWLCAATL
jgi:hypothetical protein